MKTYEYNRHGSEDHDRVALSCSLLRLSSCPARFCKVCELLFQVEEMVELTPLLAMRVFRGD